MALNNTWSMKKNQRNQDIHGNMCKLKHKDPKSLGLSKISSKRAVNSDTGIPQEMRNLNLTLSLKELKKEQMKP